MDEHHGAGEGGGVGWGGGKEGRYVCTETLIPTPMIGHACTREFAGCPRRVHAILRGYACPRVHASPGILAPLIPPLNRRDTFAISTNRAMFEEIRRNVPLLAFFKGTLRHFVHQLLSFPSPLCVPSLPLI